MMMVNQYLPPPLVHELRSRSFPRLFRMTGNPGNRGFGRVLRQRIRMLITREQTLIEKAITLAYLGSFLVDHLVFAEKTACQILERRSLSEAEEKHLWDTHYHNVVETLAAEHANGAQILEYLVRLEHYSRLPGVVHRLRTRHWRRMDKILHQEPAGGREAIDEVSMLRKIQFVLASNRSHEAKALFICMAASLLADRECVARPMDWTAAYTQIMTDFYPFLAQYPRVMDEIIKLT